MTKLGYGCVALTKFDGVKDAVRFLDTVLDYDICYFDTAPIYGQGYSEKILGSFLRNKNRANIEIATKFGLHVPPTKLNMHLAMYINSIKRRFTHHKGLSSNTDDIKIIPYREITARQIEFSFKKSLKNLGTEYIDNYMLHEAYPHFLTEDAIMLLHEYKKAGLVRKIGVASNYHNIKLCSDIEVQNWDMLQYESGELFPSKDIPLRFPTHLHVHHGLLKNTKGRTLISNTVFKDDKSDNSVYKILFSTTNYQHLQQNISYYESV